MKTSIIDCAWFCRHFWMVLLGLLHGPTLMSQEPDPEPAVEHKLPAFVNCPETSADLYLWEQAYATGQFGLIVEHIDCGRKLLQATKPTLDPSLELRSVTEKFLHLLILSNLAMGNKADADSAMVWLLTRFPRHSFDPAVDPPQFGQLLDSFVPYASNHFGVFGGPNISLLQVDDPVALRTDITIGGPVAVGPQFKNRPKMVLGLEWQHHFAFRHSIITGITSNTLSIATYYASQDFGKDHHFRQGDWTITQYDKYSFLQLPLAYQYRLPIHRPMRQQHTWLGFQAGLYLQGMIRAGTELLTTRWVSENGLDTVPQRDRLTIQGPIHRRQFYSTGVTAAISFQKEYPMWSFFLRLAGQWDFQQLRSVGAEYDPDFLGNIWSFQLSDQNFKLHSLRLTFGLFLPKSTRVKT